MKRMAQKYIFRCLGLVSATIALSACSMLPDYNDGNSIVQKSNFSDRLLDNEVSQLNRIYHEEAKFHNLQSLPVDGYFYCKSSVELAEKGQFQAAVIQARKALNLGHENKDSRLKAYAARDLGYVYLLAGELSMASDWANQALDFLREMPGIDSADAARVLGPVNRILGDIALRKGEILRAREFYDKSVAESAQDHRPLAQAGLSRALALSGDIVGARRALTLAREGAPNLRYYFDRLDGQIELDSGNYEKAAELFARAATTSCNGCDHAYHEVQALAGQGRAELALGRDAQAWSTLNKAINRAESVGGRFRAQEFKAALFGDLQTLYGDALGLAWHRNDKIAALAIAQKARARAFLDVVRDRLELREQGRPVENFDAFRARLPNDVAVVVYHIGKSRSYAWVIRRHGVTAVDIYATADALGRRVREFRDSIESENSKKGDELKRSRTELSSGARNLHKTLVARLGLRRGERLYILPHGPLHGLPFQALNDGDQWLIDQHEIAYTPFLTMSSVGERKNDVVRPQEKPLALILVNPDTQGKKDDLIYAESEGSAISGALNNYDVKLFKKGDATKKVFYQSAPMSSIAHIAGHGEVNSIDALASKLYLAEKDGESGVVTALDLYNIDLRKIKLLTISACEVGLGSVRFGDEFYGFQRTILSSGARSTILSLWILKDGAAERSMRAFYHQSQDNSEMYAMRQSILTLKKRPEYRHPFFWAPYVHVTTYIQ